MRRSGARLLLASKFLDVLQHFVIELEREQTLPGDEGATSRRSLKHFSSRLLEVETEPPGLQP